MAKADSEQLARSIAEEHISDLEKEKTMLELEVKELISRHTRELNKKEIALVSVRIYLRWFLGLFRIKYINHL